LIGIQNAWASKKEEIKKILAELAHAVKLIGVGKCVRLMSVIYYLQFSRKIPTNFDIKGFKRSLVKIFVRQMFE
jgi:hypothetical protein